MTKYKCSGFIESSKNALRGLQLIFFSQKNFRIELIAALCVISSGIFLKFSHSDMCILILICAFVLSAEMINSIIEMTLDAVYKNKYSKMVKMAKDMSAGMVLAASAAGAAAGFFLFGHYILDYINAF